MLHKPVTRGMLDKFLEYDDFPPLYADIDDTYHRQVHAQLQKLLMFQMSGMISMQKRRRDSIPLHKFHQAIQDRYIQWRCKARQLRPASIRDIKWETACFFRFLADNKVFAPSRIQSKHIINYFRQYIGLAPRTVADKAQMIQRFLKFLVEEGHLEQKILGYIPHVKYPKHSRLPDVWPKDAVKKLLSVIDTGSPTGRRNFAICLLAARLGLRVGDIRSIKIDDINWQKSTISLVQQKTGNPLELPMSEEIGNAIIDYLKNGRPKSVHRELFLTHNAPFGPFANANNCSYIIIGYRQKAGIVLPKECHNGFHSLRHSIATRLHEAEVPLNVIAAFLGHASTESVRHYAKVNTKMLRKAALEWKEEEEDE